MTLNQVSYNAGFENISIIDIAKKVQEKIPSEIIVTSSNDPLVLQTKF